MIFINFKFFSVYWSSCKEKPQIVCVCHLFCFVLFTKTIWFNSIYQNDKRFIQTLNLLVSLCSERLNTVRVATKREDRKESKNYWMIENGFENFSLNEKELMLIAEKKCNIGDKDDLFLTVTTWKNFIPNIKLSNLFSPLFFLISIEKYDFFLCSVFFFSFCHSTSIVNIGEKKIRKCFSRRIYIWFDGLCCSLMLSTSLTHRIPRHAICCETHKWKKKLFFLATDFLFCYSFFSVSQFFSFFCRSTKWYPFVKVRKIIFDFKENVGTHTHTQDKKKQRAEKTHTQTDSEKRKKECMDKQYTQVLVH